MTDTLHQQIADLETLRRLVAEGERFMTRTERLDWRRRVDRYRTRIKEHKAND